MERPAPLRLSVWSLRTADGDGGDYRAFCRPAGATRLRLFEVRQHAQPSHPAEYAPPTKGPVAQRQEQVQPKEEDVQDNELANLRRPTRWQNSEQN